MGNNDIIYWIKIVDEDIRLIINADYTNSPHTTCFICQGIAEKTMKAFLLSKKWPLKKIHDLIVLATYCEENGLDFSEYKNHIKVLNEYTVQGRYPGDIPFEEIGEKRATEAINLATELVKYVKPFISLK